MWRLTVRNYHILDIVRVKQGINVVWEYNKPTYFSYYWLWRNTRFGGEMGFFPNFVPEILVLNREEQKIQVLWPNQDTFEFSAKLLYKISHDKEPISEVKRLEYDGSCIVDLQDLKNDENVVKAFLNHIAIRGAGVVYVKKYRDHSESYNQGKVWMLGPKVIETINQLLFGVCDNQKFIHDEDLHTEGAYFENPPGIIAITNPGGVFVSDGVRIHKHMENTHSYQFLKEFKVSFSYHCNEYFFTGQHTHLGKFGDVVYCNAAKETMYCDNEYFYHLEKLKIAIITHQYFLPLTRGQILFLDNRRMLQSNGVKCYTISRNWWIGRLNWARGIKAELEEFHKYYDPDKNQNPVNQEEENIDRRTDQEGKETSGEDSGEESENESEDESEDKSEEESEDESNEDSREEGETSELEKEQESEEESEGETMKQDK